MFKGILVIEVLYLSETKKEMPHVDVSERHPLIETGSAALHSVQVMICCSVPRRKKLHYRYSLSISLSNTVVLSRVWSHVWCLTQLSVEDAQEVQN